MRLVRVSPDRANAALDLVRSIFSIDRIVDANRFKATFGNEHEMFLKEATKSLNVERTGELHHCPGFSTAKGMRKTISSSSGNRGTTKLQQVYVDFFGLKSVASPGGKLYI